MAREEAHHAPLSRSPSPRPVPPERAGNGSLLWRASSAVFSALVSPRRKRASNAAGIVNTTFPEISFPDDGFDGDKVPLVTSLSNTDAPPAGAAEPEYRCEGSARPPIQPCKQAMAAEGPLVSGQYIDTAHRLPLAIATARTASEEAPHPAGTAAARSAGTSAGAKTSAALLLPPSEAAPSPEAAATASGTEAAASIATPSAPPSPQPTVAVVPPPTPVATRPQPTLVAAAQPLPPLPEGWASYGRRLLKDTYETLFSPGAVRVLGGLWWGGLDAALDAEWLETAGVTHIVGLCEATVPAVTARTLGLRVLHVDDLLDEPDAPLLPRLAAAAAFVHGCRLGGGCCYVHCKRGRSRSAAAVIVYLMGALEEVTYDEALAYCVGLRSVACPNGGFQAQLHAFQHSAAHRELAKQLRALSPADFALPEGGGGEGATAAEKDAAMAVAAETTCAAAEIMAAAAATVAVAPAEAAAVVAEVTAAAGPAATEAKAGTEDGAAESIGQADGTMAQTACWTGEGAACGAGALKTAPKEVREDGTAPSSPAGAEGAAGRRKRPLALDFGACGRSNGVSATGMDDKSSNHAHPGNGSAAEDELLVAAVREGDACSDTPGRRAASCERVVGVSNTGLGDEAGGAGTIGGAAGCSGVLGDGSSGGRGGSGGGAGSGGGRRPGTVAWQADAGALLAELDMAELRRAISGPNAITVTQRAMRTEALTAAKAFVKHRIMRPAAVTLT